ncbi:uncharacterized protein LOC116851362 [Odontomachus brunneus]|uniref:uncharacterized protein LOC116851362 n=1 Tax=Odontomachus brunneus TaxID=486640 RepID=UPI0013F286E4|nr:uncharacterized protein LOC116851362 [Odontomachus brunneus]
MEVGADDGHEESRSGPLRETNEERERGRLLREKVDRDRKDGYVPPAYRPFFGERTIPLPDQWEQAETAKATRGRGGRVETRGLGQASRQRAATGALVLEVSGPEGQVKAESLAAKIRTLFAEEEGVRIARPAKRAELRVRDLDDAVTTEDVVAAVASFGGCGPEDIRAGAIRAKANGLSTMCSARWPRRRGYWTVAAFV